MPFKFHLQPYMGRLSRYRCPQCNHSRKTFKLYIDIETGDPLAPHVGKCDRADNCGYHFTPRQYFAATSGAAVMMSNSGKMYRRKSARAVPSQEYYIHPDHVNSSFTNYAANHFYLYLVKRLGLQAAMAQAQTYRLGTSSHWYGATVFWQIDKAGNVRTGKIMLYDKDTGKRVKQPFNHITWAHSQLLRQMDATPPFTLQQCFFGEHLLTVHPTKPVAITESEKTAMLADALMPAFIWLACGGLEGLTIQRFRVLAGRKVILFPDASGYAKWLSKANELQLVMPATIIRVSQELELMAKVQDKHKGADLGDIDWV